MEKSDFIILDGKNEYPDINVSMHRLGYTNKVKKLDFDLRNTAKEKDRTEYMGNINHGQALEINTKLNGFTLPPLYFADMLYQLIETIKCNRKTYDGNGKEIDFKRIKYFYNEIAEIRDPWRAEHLDAEFGKNTITYHKFVNGKFEEVTEEIEDCLMQDREIDLEDWLKNQTSQGFPRKNCKEGKLNFWYPREGAVARFLANSGWAVLGCNWGPLLSYAELGVRYSFSAKGTQKISAPELYSLKQISNVLNEVGITGSLEEQILSGLKTLI